MQRVKRDCFWRERCELQKGGLKRLGRQVSVRPLLLVACEGEETEPNYIRDYFRELIGNRVISPKSCVIAPHGHTDPCGVLDDLLGYRNLGMRADDFERKWIFIDRDEARTNEGSGHTKENFCNALLKAAKKKVKVAWSNPCFELWFLLHFEYRGTAVDRSDLPGILEKYIGREYEKSLRGMYKILRDKMTIAIENSQKLEQSYTAEPSIANPMTTVHRFFLENHAGTMR